MTETLTDWRGRDYGVGDLVLYVRHQQHEIYQAYVLAIRALIWDRALRTHRPAERSETPTKHTVKLQPFGLGSRRVERTLRPVVLHDITCITRL